MPISWTNPMQVTISLLPVSLSLVHIPRSRLAQLSHPVLRQILHPNPTFLNITCNEIELSIFAEDYMLEDFEPIARRDRHRQRSRSGSGSSRKNIGNNNTAPVEISYEKWCVLQIDSHTDQLDNSGARVNELSAPLAAAGISILYQSSYMCDFIFVKESRLREAMNLFTTAGFDLYSPERDLSTPHTFCSHENVIDGWSSIHDFAVRTTPTAVLTRSRSGTDTSVSPIISSTQKSSTTETHGQAVSESDKQTGSGQAIARNKSHSPTSGEVRLLSPDFTCVGLSDELGVDHWGLKIVKLVAFPDLISASSPAVPRSSARVPPFHGHHTHHTKNSVYEACSHIHVSPARGRSSTESSSSSSSNSDDGYFSHSPQTKSPSSLMTSASRSSSDLMTTVNTPQSKSPSKHLISTILPLSPINPAPLHPGLSQSGTPGGNTSLAEQDNSGFQVPFFSFTRTPEGSSLTADVYLLATLFPPYERHMVICAGELDAADERLINGIEPSDDNEDSLQASSMLKCLQIDLRRFGLDKHGLVHHFSRVLEENDINHMYSSTFKTANLLVDKRHALRAQSLLGAC